MDGRLPQRRPLAVLAVLAVSRALGCSRAKLIGLLWPDDDEAHARHHLSDALSTVRRVLGPGSVQTSGEMLYADPAELRSDVAAFEDAVAAGRLEEAVAHYGGSLLDGFYVSGSGEFDDWVCRERVRLAGQYGAALERLAHAAMAGGHPRSATEWLGRFVANDPCNSRVVLRLVAALEAAGDRPGALRAVEQHVARLRGELEVDPDPSVLQVLQRLRAPVSPPLGDHLSRATMAPATAATATPAIAVERPPMRLGVYGRHVLAVTAAAGLMAVMSLVAVRLWNTPPSPVPEHWLVMPFAMAGADSFLLRLSADMPALVEMRLPGPPGAHVLDRAGALRRWRSAAGDLHDGLPERDVLRIARDMGAGRVLLGSLARRGSRIEVVLRLLEAPGGDHRGVQAGSAPADSTAVLLDQLIESLRRQDAALPGGPSDDR